MDELLLEVCSICSELMKDPRILPCAHSFCLECLKSSTISKELPKCPTCQMHIEIPQSGLKDLKKNEFIEHLNNLRQNNIKCDSCMKNVALKHCLDCSFNYCLTCLTYHAVIPTTSNHQLQQTSTKSEINFKKYSYCEDHMERITLVCENCKIGICSHCLTLKHKKHNFLHVSEYFYFTKITFEGYLKSKEETLQNVFKNVKCSEDIKQYNKLKATNLKTEIQERGEDAKEIIDSIVDALNKNIDEESKRLKKTANKVLAKLKKMAKKLSGQIETLRHQLKNLSYANVTETESNILHEDEPIPIYSEYLDKSFYFDEDLNQIEKIFGNLYNEFQGSQPILEEEDTIDSDVEAMSLYEGNAFVLERAKWTTFKVKRHFENCYKKSYIKFYKHLVEVGNLLVIDGMFFFYGISERGHHYILHVLKNIHNWEIFQIYNHPPLVGKFPNDKIGMSKTICGNILVNLIDKIIHLSTNGLIIKRIKLPFSIHDAVQLSKESYVVCCNDEVCIVGNNGNILVKHSYHLSYSGLNHDLKSPRRLAKDRRGTIYVYDSETEQVFIFDRCLRIKSSFDVNCQLREILYDEERNYLVILCEDNSMLTYAL